VSSTVLQLLQQEKARLEKQSKTQQTEIQTLQRYIDLLAKLYWSAQEIASEKNYLTPSINSSIRLFTLSVRRMVPSPTWTRIQPNWSS
jgi:hypothetical protein